MRLKQMLFYYEHRQTCVYLMTKTFRIRNNYTLYEALRYAKENELELHIYVVEPYEENPLSLEFFHVNTTDLLEKLNVFSYHVSLIKRTEIKKHLQDHVQAIFMDFSYLTFDINMLKHVMKQAKLQSINLFQVESNVFVPVRDASDKEEYGAYTIRPKIKKLMPYFDEEVLIDEDMILGEKAALRTLKQFLSKKLPFYESHNDPSKHVTSRLSSYLKYGFISPVTIYQYTKSIDEEMKASFLEELIIRRELAYNYVYYNPAYESFEKMTERWAYLTMKDHEKDERPYSYQMDDYIAFKTHDKYFNAAMKQMVYTGYMHGYMRMYWAKKIIEWSPTYKEAYQTAISLNNRYFIDGLTPNGYTGVAWCFGKHDRPWKERAIFGKLRYMNDKGLVRKFDIEQYVTQMNLIEKEYKK